MESVLRAGMIGWVFGLAVGLVGCGEVGEEKVIEVVVEDEAVEPAPEVEAKRERVEGKVFRLDLSEAEVGSEPEGLFVVDGVFVAAESGEGVVLEMRAEPLVEGLVLLGEPMRGGGVIRAKVSASKRGRSYPRFGVGLHGISGYRIRVVPARKSVEMIKDDEVVVKAAYAWAEGVATWLEMKVAWRGGDQWRVEGVVWAEGDPRPEEPQLVLEVEGGRYSGKAVLSGTPYAGLPIQFADVFILGEADEGNGG